jgi:hypothetical protein
VLAFIGYAAFLMEDSKERAQYDAHYKVPCCKTIKGAGLSGLFSSIETPMAHEEILECMSSDAELDVLLVSVSVALVYSYCA